jgi:pimeloyl-ACP methyl ester carboxylesterase
MNFMNNTADLPVLLLIPGMLNTARIWNRVMPLLDGIADVRIVDVTQQTSIADMARDAWALVADVPATKRLVVCGFSMGGYVALELVDAYLLGKRPDAAWALGLLNTSAAAESAEGLVFREKTIKAIERDFERVIQGIATFGVSKAHHADAQLMAEVLSIMREAGAATAVAQLRAIMQRRDQSQLLQRINARVLVMGSKDDLVVPAAASHYMAARLPNAQLEWIAPAGHMTPLEQSAQLAALLKTLL